MGGGDIGFIADIAGAIIKGAEVLYYGCIIFMIIALVAAPFAIWKLCEIILWVLS